MKIQCACGAKYSFDATPEMLQNPVKFVCPNCGLDSSAFVNELVRREFAGQAPAAPEAATPPPPPADEAPRLRISHAAAPAPAAPAEPPSPVPTPEGGEFCAKHRREPAVHHCLVCKKPMCSLCMKLFGYVCSPLCRAQAEARRMDIPMHASQGSLAEARFWRMSGAIGVIVAILILGGVIFWGWYAWVGSVPHVALSVKYDDRAYAGASELCGTNQFVFLHGGTLARYDLKSGRQIWSDELVTKQQIDDAVSRKNDSQPRDRFEQRIPQYMIEAEVTGDLEQRLQLHVLGQNIWVESPGKFTCYDWDTGKVSQKISLAESGGEVTSQNGEFLAIGEGADGQTLLMHINPVTGESSAEPVGQPGQTLAASTSSNGGNQASGGLPLSPGANGTGPMDPNKVAEQAQNMSMPGRIALPALLANSSEQEQLAAEMQEEDQSGGPPARPRQSKPAQTDAARFILVAGQNDCVQFSVKLVESHIVSRDATKAAPRQSALDGNLSAANSTAAVNEMLNEMQRNRGGNIVQEDDSIYEVSLRGPDSTGSADWTGQVTGPPQLIPLKTVNVLVAGKTVIVFDKTNKKLWQATLTYNIVGNWSPPATEGGSSYGDGPCVERGGTLYVFDQAVLTAFDLATGDARWRLPSVGVVGLFFDDKGMLYVNTTTADPESVKYSRQIDITQKIEAVLLKVDPQSGKTLWSIKPGGFINYLSGPYIYTVQFYDPGDDEQSSTAAAIQMPPFLRIRRISPGDGHDLWVYQEDRAPLSVQFQNNYIELVFKKEVEVLKYLSL
jgi:hypothetical protein